MPHSQRLDAWIARQREPLTRPEAIRRLIAAGVSASVPPSRAKAQSAAVRTAADRAEAMAKAKKKKRG